jgi:hypothetical protein
MPDIKNKYIFSLKNSKREISNMVKAIPITGNADTK